MEGGVRPLFHTKGEGWLYGGWGLTPPFIRNRKDAYTEERRGQTSPSYERREAAIWRVAEDLPPAASSLLEFCGGGARFERGAGFGCRKTPRIMR
jgi:hypothetical protein